MLIIKLYTQTRNCCTLQAKKFTDQNFLKQAEASRVIVYESSLTSRRILRKENQSILIVCVSNKEHRPREALEQRTVQEGVNHQKSFVPQTPRILEDNSELLSCFSVMVWWNETMSDTRRSSEIREISTRCRQASQILNEEILDIDKTLEMEGNTAPSAG